MTCQVASRVLCSEGPFVSASLLCVPSSLAWYHEMWGEVLNKELRKIYDHNHPFIKRYELDLALFHGCRSLNCGLGSSVGIATDNELDGPGIESRWG